VDMHEGYKLAGGEREARAVGKLVLLYVYIMKQPVI
jgi:hypothetical protein